MISLQDAKQLVVLLEQEQQQEASELLKTMHDDHQDEIYRQVGELTRELHDSLQQFNSDSRINELANDEIPDARDRLEYVITKTEQAANKTMDAVDRSMPIADRLHQGLVEVRPQWNQLMNGSIDINEFKALCHRIDGMLSQVEGDSTELRGQLTEILMAQDFQDLTGQIIRRVITLVEEVEGRLVEILTVFGEAERQQKTESPAASPITAEGPILNAEQREDAVASQDEVDDLLSSLGF
ncbi:protein phosphatase CheZ [Vibrio maerlii]|uniref:protein phosphatase CheZ n=1 Tax=Vibrio maerlii TaxID=2231648 RepID=UPI000E3CF669|nr:protein phosphatase CheZ [Vibrio maerlii]